MTKDVKFGTGDLQAPAMTVLLVDDVVLFLELEKSFLEPFFSHEGFHLLMARTGEEAVTLAKEYRPNLVFMDLYMPQMDGDEACHLIKAQSGLSHTSVVMVTEGVRPGDLERCNQSGCDDILLKPIDRQRFVETFHKFLQINGRTAPRVEARLSIRYGDAQNLLTNYSVNLSTGGVFLETRELLPPNTALVLEFVLPEPERKIACDGRVAWVNEPKEIINSSLPVGMGLQFLDLHGDELSALRKYITAQNIQPSW